MSQQIVDGTGSAFLAKVDSTNHLHTLAISESIQHHISHAEEGAFQLIGLATLAAATVAAIHVKNTSNKLLVVTYIRHQVIAPTGGTSFPNASNYFRVAFGRTYDSGGSTIKPVNVYAGSGVESELTCYDSSPTLAGTAIEIDRWYTKEAGDMHRFYKEGAVIVPPSQNIEFSYVGDRTGGLLYTRISFLMQDIKE